VSPSGSQFSGQANYGKAGRLVTFVTQNGCSEIIKVNIRDEPRAGEIRTALAGPSKQPNDSIKMYDGYFSRVFATGRIDAIDQPCSSRTKVWQMRRVFLCGWPPGRLRVKAIGTRICTTSCEIAAA